MLSQPTLIEDRSQALLRKAKDSESMVWIARSRSALARHHLYGGCRSDKGGLQSLDVKVPHSRVDEADSGDTIVLELQRRGTRQRASTGQNVSRVILTLAKDVRACGTPKQVPSE